ncbi:unnamed protein product [Rangifer tarandus platyrhynchus]|uniref:Uncharacterized protein n=1 Tax=Rangifer tarandus platyrhynchus TaxID=3082113 RepID=A0AC59ZPX8_RANTA
MRVRSLQRDGALPLIQSPSVLWPQALGQKSSRDRSGSVRSRLHSGSAQDFCFPVVDGPADSSSSGAVLW